MEELKKQLEETKRRIDFIERKPVEINAPLSYKNKQIIYNELFFPLVKELIGTTPATAVNFGRIFIADRPCEVVSVQCVFGTASTSGTLQIEKLTGTQALDAGTVILTATMSLSGTADTVVTGTLAAGVAKQLAPGDRLALKDAGTLTNLVDLCVVIGIRYI